MTVDHIYQRRTSRALNRRAVFGTERRTGVYEEIIHGHPDALDGYQSIRIRFNNAPLRVVQGSSSDLFFSRCSRVIESMRYNDTRGTSAHDCVEHLADAIVFGCALFEAHWIQTGGSPVVSLCPIPIRSVIEWVSTDVGIAAVQRTKNGSVMVPADRLVHITPIDSAGPEGIGVLRPLIFPFELWKQTMHDMGVRIGNEAGAVIATEPKRCSEHESESILDAASKVASGSVNAAKFPAGTTIETLSLPPASNPMAVVEYCDQKIQALFDDTLKSLVTSSTGSRALGDSVNEGSDDSRRSKLDYCVSGFGRELFTFVARSFGYSGPLPSLTSIPGDEVDAADRVPLLVQARPLVGWHDADREALRETLGLAPIDEAGGVIAAPTSPAQFSLVQDNVTMAVDKPPDFDKLVGGIMRLINGRNRDDSSLRQQIWRITRDLRARAFARIKSGSSPNELGALRTLYIAKVATVIIDHAEKRREKAFKWGGNIRRTTDVNEDESAPSDHQSRTQFRDEMAQLTSKITASSRSAATTIVDRVMGELTKQVIHRGDGDEAVDGAEKQGTRITKKGLANEASAVGHQAEQLGRLEGAADAAGGDMVVVGVWRVSMEDSARCSVCRSKTGVYHPLSEGLPQVPDPECLGGVDRCRCGLIPKMVHKRAEVVS